MDDTTRELDYSLDRGRKGWGARRSVASENGIDWETVEESDNLTALGQDASE